MTGRHLLLSLVPLTEAKKGTLIVLPACAAQSRFPTRIAIDQGGIPTKGGMKHYSEQNELVDRIAERIQSLGAISLSMAADVAETTIIPRPPRGREEVPVQISRLLEAHEGVLKEARTMAQQADKAGDDGTNDLLVCEVIRTNELQVWFLAEHVADVPAVRADQAMTATSGR